MSSDRTAVAVLVSSVVLSLSAACITPPVIFPAGSREMLDLSDFPDGAELVEVPVADDIVLRGIYMPSDEGAPVVLHLLEAGGSVGPHGIMWATSGGFAGMLPIVRPVFAELAHRGFASLALDYEGIGASDGDRSPRHLARDARAAWEEAVRRAGGRPDRVIVRGNSIGTLAAACLLESGARPAGLVLASPVFSDSVSRNYGRAVYGVVLTALALPFFEEVMETDLDTALMTHPVPHMSWVLAGDELLSEEDLTRLQAVADAAGGRMHRASEHQEHREVPEIVRLPRHVRGALAARGVLPTEDAFLDVLFPDAPPELQRIHAGRAALPVDLLARFHTGSSEAEALERRLVARLGDDPELVAWTVLTGMSDEDAEWSLEYQGASVRWWRSESTPEVLSQRIDMDDPAGTMPLSTMLSLARKLHVHEMVDRRLTVDELLVIVAGCGAPHISTAIWNPELTTPEGTPFLLRYDLRKNLWKPVSRGGVLPLADAARQTLRLVFKAAGYPERVVTEPDGTHRLEVLDGETWRTVDPGLVLEPRADGE